MLSRLIEFCLNNQLLVIILVLLMAIAGLYSASTIPIDAIPDMTNIQVQVITEAGSLSPVEVERYITYPIETTMGGLPSIEELRSVSKLGLSVVTVVFEERHRHLSRTVPGTGATGGSQDGRGGLRRSGDRCPVNGTRRDPSIRGPRSSPLADGAARDSGLGNCSTIAGNTRVSPKSTRTAASTRRLKSRSIPTVWPILACRLPT